MLFSFLETVNDIGWSTINISDVWNEARQIPKTTRIVLTVFCSQLKYTVYKDNL